MKRINALISGEVQGVGYREAVKRFAFELSIYGWVRNLEDGRVEITAEGENQSIEKFFEKININRYPIFVEKVETKEEIYKGDLKSFKVIRDKDLQKEILSALSRGTVDIHEMKEIMKAVREDTAHIPEIRENTTIMLEKQDLHIKITETGFGEVKEEIHMLRDDFRELFMHEVGELRSEIAEIKATLARMQAAG
ncbi:MAG: acylphosphatase [Candidatus Methanoperedens sp.]|nr:acylphosphatase [Candidatus Methanoperedens sp.]MCZ7396030.1 acylphosphatase [Candidatus Methanoperedens sp.]